MADKDSIFRKESLERLSSPERLDQLMQVVNPLDWLPLITLGSFILLGIIWSIFGRIPITVTGKGILIQPHQVIILQSPISGQLNSVNVKPGQCIEKGHLLATIDSTQLQTQLLANNQIVSLSSGCVLEVSAFVGQVTNPGTPLFSLNIGDKNAPIIAVSYFDVKDGKQIQPGMKVQITPDSIKRERFGGLIGQVTSVSPFPVTKEGATSVIGNPDLVAKILPTGGGDIEVRAEMLLDSSTFSGYRWSSSQGPKLKISSGTTTNMRVQVAEQAPITYILPILREFTGIN